MPTVCGRQAAWRRTRPSAAGRRRRSRASSSSSPSWPRRVSSPSPTSSSRASSTGSRQWPIRAPSCCSSARRAWPGVYPVRAAFPAGMAQTSDVAAALPAAPAAYRWNGDHRGAARHGCRSRDAVSPRPGAARASTSSTAERPRATTSVPEETGWRRTARRRRASWPASAVPAAHAASRRTSPCCRFASPAGSAMRPGSGRSTAGPTRSSPASNARSTPNRNGDAHDAARVTLIPLSEPFSAFPDNALSRAVSGAVALDSLVVVPAGNDGPGGPGFGSIGGPGGAPEALTAGAADLQADRLAGLGVVPGRPAGAAPPAARAAHSPRRRTPAPTFDVVRRTQRRRDLFGPKGKSRVAGRAALLAAGCDAAAGGRAGSRSGRRGRRCSPGTTCPAASLGLDPALKVPVLSAPAALPSARSPVRAREGAATVARHRPGLDEEQPA